MAEPPPSESGAQTDPGDDPSSSDVVEEFAEPSVSIVGVGLIGGSIAAGLKSRGYTGVIQGIGRNRERLEGAREAGLIDDVSTSRPEGTLVVYCTPVSRIAAQVVADAPRFPAGTLVTDGGSVKGPIVNGVADRTPDGVTFVGSHPLAGSEKSGYEHARADLFEGRLCVVTPLEGTPADEVGRVRSLWRYLGMRVAEMDAEEHDRILAMSSHVPHVVAAVLAGCVAPSELPFTATGFRDTTRIAAGDPEIWVPILMANREAVMDGLQRAKRRLERFQRALEVADTMELERLLAQGKLIRDAIDP